MSCEETKEAEGETKLGPASGMVRGLRYGEEDEMEDQNTTTWTQGYNLIKKWGSLMDPPKEGQSRLASWKFALDTEQTEQVVTENTAEDMFADNPMKREVREFAQSGEMTNEDDIDPSVKKTTPPTPDEIPQDSDVRTLSRLKVEEKSVKNSKLENWTFAGETNG